MFLIRVERKQTYIFAFLDLVQFKFKFQEIFPDCLGAIALFPPRGFGRQVWQLQGVNLRNIRRILF